MTDDTFQLNNDSTDIEMGINEYRLPRAIVQGATVAAG